MVKKLTTVIVTVFFVLGSVPGVFALEVTGSPPTVTGTNADTVNSAISSAWNQLMSDLNGDKLLKNISSEPENLIRAFGTASVYASQGATQRGYGQPRLFNLSVGPMMGVKIGAGLKEVASYFGNLRDEFVNNGDATMGMNMSLSLQYNLNASFLLEGLGLGLMIGYFKLDDSLIDGFSFDTFTVGMLGSYQLLKEKTLAPVVLKWRGLRLGTGLVFQNSNIKYAMALDPITQNIAGGASLSVDPRLAFNMKNWTITVPLEATTALQLLSFLNITLGVGADFGFGKNDTSIGIDANVNLENLPSGVTQEQSGSLGVSGGGELAPNFLNFKIMTGIGFKFGSVYLDVPVIFYPGADTGVSVGVTLGVSI